MPTCMHKNLCSWSEQQHTYLISCYKLNKCCMADFALRLLSVRMQLLGPLHQQSHVNSKSPCMRWGPSAFRIHLQKSPLDGALACLRLHAQSVIV